MDPAALPELYDAGMRYRAFVELLPMATYVEQLGEASAAYISGQIFDLVGYTPAEWTADKDFFGRVLHPDDRDDVLAAFAELHKTGDPVEREYRLLARDGRTVWIHDAAVGVRDDAGHLRYAQGYMTDISERKRNEAALREVDARLREQIERVEYQALHDSLTGLPNRSLFADRAEQAIRDASRNGTGLAVMMLDLDRFKEVNDTLGHSAGDQLLVDVGTRASAALREVDTVARFGGDEFAILAPGLADPKSACALAEKLRLAVGTSLLVGDLELKIEASVGIALYPEHGADGETLVRRADAAMYVGKTTHSPVVYKDGYDGAVIARLELLSELRKALGDGELVVDFQPQTDVATGRVRRVEALVRWQHPKHGLLSPDQFLPLAEESGLIRSLTRHVLDAALRRCSEWRAQGLDLSVSVNITGSELADSEFPDEVAGLLAKWDVDPANLTLEITEQAIMVDSPERRAVLGRLRGLGIDLAMDEFGSALASLAHLRSLPISLLKIDKSFVHGMVEGGTADLVKAAIELGHSLGLQVIADGVESGEATRQLEALGCDLLQGPHVGHPERDIAGLASGDRIDRIRPVPLRSL